jgi:hypothetical protein
LSRFLVGNFASGSTILDLVDVLMRRSRTLWMMNRYNEARDDLNEVLDIIEDIKKFPSNFLSSLHNCAALFTFLIYRLNMPTNQQRDMLTRYINQLNDWLALRDQAALHAQRLNIEGIWKNCLEDTLNLKRYGLSMEILAQSHARHLMEIAQTELYQTQKTALSEQESRYLDGISKLTEMSLGLSDEDGAEELSKAYESLRNDLLSIRSELVAQGRLPDLKVLDQCNPKNMQAGLSAGSVLLVGMVPQSYGIDQPPLLLMIWPNDISAGDSEPRIEALPIPQAVAAYEAFNDIESHTARESGNKGMRDAGYPAVPEVMPVRDQSQAWKDLSTAMDAIWRIVLAKLEQLCPECREIRLVTHGVLHTLPWQGSCPPEVNLTVNVYPGLYSYWQNSQHDTVIESLQPSRELKIRVLASDAANDPLNRLYFVEAERRIIRKIWDDAVVEVTANDFESSKETDAIPNIMLLSGHGNIKKGFVLKYESGTPKYLGQSELLRSRHALQGLIASACLLGRSTDKGHEPHGLLAFARARKNLRFACGALLPVGDFAACVLSLLFHTQWRNDSSPDKAMAKALKQLEIGEWPDEAIKVFKEVFTEYLPELANAIRSDQNKMSKPDDSERFEKRIKNMLWFLHCKDPGCHEYLDALMDLKNEDDQKAAAKELTECMFETQYLRRLGDSLKQNFIPFWTWG